MDHYKVGWKKNGYIMVKKKTIKNELNYMKKKKIALKELLTKTN
jgi:hypothetical protein